MSLWDPSALCQRSTCSLSSLFNQHSFSLTAFWTFYLMLHFLYHWEKFWSSRLQFYIFFILWLDGIDKFRCRKFTKSEPLIWRLLIWPLLIWPKAVFNKLWQVLEELWLYQFLCFVCKNLGDTFFISQWRLYQLPTFKRKHWSRKERSVAYVLTYGSSRF